MVIAGQAESPKEAAEVLAKVQQAKWNAHYARFAADYEIACGKEGKQKLVVGRFGNQLCR